MSLVLRSKKIGRRPLGQEISFSRVAIKIYFSQWDALVKDGVLFKKLVAPNLNSSFLQTIVPRNRVKRILEETHDSPSRRHFGLNKILDKIKRRFYWTTPCKGDVKNWCRSCKVRLARSPADKGKSSLQIYNVGTPFERVQMDILGPLPVIFSGNKYLLVIVDCFMKWSKAFPLKNKKASIL